MFLCPLCRNQSTAILMPRHENVVLLPWLQRLTAVHAYHSITVSYTVLIFFQLACTRTPSPVIITDCGPDDRNDMRLSMQFQGCISWPLHLAVWLITLTLREINFSANPKFVPVSCYHSAHVHLSRYTICWPRVDLNIWPIRPYQFEGDMPIRYVAFRVCAVCKCLTTLTFNL